MTDRNRIPCDQALRLLAEYLDDELSDLERHDVRHHLDTCRGCYSRAEFEQQLRAQLATLGRLRVRSEFEWRVRTLISRFILVPESVSSDE